MTLLQTDEILNKALEVSPSNGIAYGVLVALLIIGLVFLWKEVSRERSYSREIAERVIKLSEKVGSGLDGDKLWKEDVRQKITDLSTEVKLLEQSVRNHFPDKYKKSD